jgi:hypothetical protein
VNSSYQILSLCYCYRGLPGGLKLTKKETTTYFGGEARAEFFERYRWLHSQRQNAGTLSDEPTNVILFPDSYLGRPTTVNTIWEDEGVKTEDTKAVAEARNREKKTAGKVGTSGSDTESNGFPTGKELVRGRAGTILSPVHKRAQDGKAVIADPTYRDKVERNPNLMVQTAPTVGKGRHGTRVGTQARGSISGATNIPVMNAAGNVAAGRMASTKTRGSVMFQLESLFPDGASGDEADKSAEESEKEAAAAAAAKEAAESRVQVTLSRIDPGSRRRKELSDSVSDFPFAPARTEEELRMRTKVIIRTQLLLQGEGYEELKLVQKPQSVIEAEQRQQVADAQASESRAEWEGVSYSGQGLMNAVYDADGNVVDGVTALANALQRQSLLHAAPSSAQGKHHATDKHSTHGHSGHGSHGHTDAHHSASHGHAHGHGAHAHSPEHSKPSAVAAGPSGHLALSAHAGRQPLAPITTDLRSPTSTITSAASPQLSPLKGHKGHGAHSTSKSRKHPHSPDKHSKPVTPTANKLRDAPRSPPPLNTPKMRGTKESVYGPSKYGRTSNSLLPSLGLNNPLAPKAHHGGHAAGHGILDSGTFSSGNTAIGDAILAKLNATAKSLQEALVRETELSHQQQQQAQQQHGQAHHPHHPAPPVHHPFWSDSGHPGNDKLFLVPCTCFARRCSFGSIPFWTNFFF